MRFQDIHGLDEVKDRLVKSVRKDQIAHAFLLSGEPGCLNLPLALAFATYLNCENKQESDSCGQCPSCLKNSKYVHPDLNFVFPVTTRAGVKPKDVISQTFLTEWRQFLLEKPWAAEDTWATYLGSEDKQFNISKEESRQIISNLSLKAFEGEYKIMLIWLPEYMHPSAANGILKILEEPTDKTVFLLVTNDREQLLGTILSRVLTFPVRKLSQDELVNTLMASNDFPGEKARSAARTAEGSLDLALSQSENGEEELIAEFRNWLLLCFQFKRSELVSFTDMFNSMNKLNQRGFLKYGLSVLRELIIQKQGTETLQRSNAGEKEFVEKLSQQLSLSQIENMQQLLEGSLYYLERNVNPKATFLNLSLKVAVLFRSKNAVS